MSEKPSETFTDALNASSVGSVGNISQSSHNESRSQLELNDSTIIQPKHVYIRDSSNNSQISDISGRSRSIQVNNMSVSVSSPTKRSLQTDNQPQKLPCTRDSYSVNNHVILPSAGTINMASHSNDFKSSTNFQQESPRHTSEEHQIDEHHNFVPISASMRTLSQRSKVEKLESSLESRHMVTVSIGNFNFRLSFNISLLLENTNNIFLAITDPLRYMLDSDQHTINIQYTEHRKTPTNSSPRLPAVAGSDILTTVVSFVHESTPLIEPLTKLYPALVRLALRLPGVIHEIHKQLVVPYEHKTLPDTISSSDADSIILSISGSSLHLLQYPDTVEAMVEALKTLQTPIISARKKRNTIHWGDTESSGHSFLLALHQASRRRWTTTGFNTEFPECLHIQDSADSQREYEEWGLELILANQHHSAYKWIQYDIDNATSIININKWIGATVLEGLQLPFEVAIWQTTLDDDEYSSLAWIPSRMNDAKLTRSPKTLAFSQWSQYFTHQNDIEMDNLHFYLLPTNDANSANLLQTLHTALYKLAEQCIRAKNNVEGDNSGFVVVTSGSELAHSHEQTSTKHSMVRRVNETSQTSQTTPNLNRSLPLMPSHSNLHACLNPSDFQIQFQCGSVRVRLSILLSEASKKWNYQLMTRDPLKYLLEFELPTIIIETTTPSSLIEYIEHYPTNGKDTVSTVAYLIDQQHSSCNSTPWITQVFPDLAHRLLHIIPVLHNKHVKLHGIQLVDHIRALESKNDLILLQIPRFLFTMFLHCQSVTGIEHHLRTSRTACIQISKRVEPPVQSPEVHEPYDYNFLQVLHGLHSTGSFSTWLQTLTTKSSHTPDPQFKSRLNFAESPNTSSTPLKAGRIYNKDLPQLVVDIRLTSWQTITSSDIWQSHLYWSNRLSPSFQQPSIMRYLTFDDLIKLAVDQPSIETNSRRSYVLPHTYGRQRLISTQIETQIKSLSYQLYWLLSSGAMIDNPLLSGTDLQKYGCSLLSTPIPEQWQSDTSPSTVVDLMANILTKPSNTTLVGKKTLHLLESTSQIKKGSSDSSKIAKQPVSFPSLKYKPTVGKNTSSLSNSVSKSKKVSSTNMRTAKQPVSLSSLNQKPIQTKLSSSSTVTSDLARPSQNNKLSSSSFSPIRFDMEALQKAIDTDRYFTEKQNRLLLEQQLTIGLQLDGNNYPALPLREKLDYLLCRTAPGDSSVCSEKGLFTEGEIPANRLIGIYAGKRYSQHNSYSMSITSKVSVGDVPNEDDEWTKFGYINEFLPTLEGNNASCQKMGMIYSVNLIPGYREILMPYGQYYGYWHELKQSFKSSLINKILDFSEYLEVSPEAEDALEAYDLALDNPEYPEFNRLLTEFFSFEGYSPADFENSFPSHDFLPTFEDDIYAWFEVMLRCKWFYHQNHFRQYTTNVTTQYDGWELPPLLSTLVLSSASRLRPRRSQPSYADLVNSDSDAQSEHSQFSQVEIRRLAEQHSQETTPPPSSKTYYLRQQTKEDFVVLLYQDHRSRSSESTSNTEQDKDDDESDDTDQSSADESDPTDLPPATLPHSTSNSHSSTTAPRSNLPLGSNSTTSMLPPSTSTVNAARLPTTARSPLDDVADTLLPPKKVNNPPDTSLRVMSFNMGGRQDMKLYETTEMIHKLKLDVTFLLDIRVARGSEYSLQTQLRLSLGSSFCVFVFPTIPRPDQAQLVGGTVVILSTRINQAAAIQLIPLGTVVQLKCTFGSTPLTILAVYIPQRNTEAGSLQSRLAETMSLSPVQVRLNIHDTIQSAVLDAQAQHRPVVITGDFNADISSTLPPALRYLDQELRLVHSASPEELLESSYNRGDQGSETYVSTRIDFSLHYGLIRSTKCECYTYPTYTNDHTPLITTYDFPGNPVPFEPMLTAVGQVRLPPDTQARADYKKLCSEIRVPQELSANEKLRYIHEQAVRAAASIQPPAKARRITKTVPLSWTPINAAFKKHLEYTITLNRHMFGNKGHKQWTKRSYGRELRTLRQDWTRDIKQLGSTPEESKVLLEVSPFNPATWINMTRAQIITRLPLAIASIRKQLNYKLRRHRAEAYKKHKESLSFLLQCQKIGGPISSVLRNRQQPYSMEELVINGVRTTLPGVITEVLTSNFRDEWFNFPEGAAGIPWASTLISEEAFRLHARTKNIPEHLINTLWISVSRRPPATAKFMEFQQTAMRTPTFEEYMTMVRSSSAHSAGGGSGLSYDMMKEWPEDLHRECYNALVTNWENQQFPDEWKWRWLLPIPKAPNPTPKQLRPICLLEVTRKLWSKIFVQRIATFLQQENILHPGQHSGKGKGTDSAILEFAATLETAKEFKTELFISSWDMSRAFDSVDRQILLFSWVRVGVPYALAYFLVSMDFEAVMAVRTPLAKLIHAMLGREGLDKHGISFHPQRGTAQGGVDSSLGFAVFLDILLYAIEIGTKPEDRFYLSDIDGTLQPADQIAYVDDLLNMCATAGGLQNTADIVSAFCTMFHIDLNTSKFRAYAVNWGNPNRPGMPTMTIHTSGWTPMVVPMRTDGSMEHLGITWDMSLDNVTMFQKMHLAIRTTLGLVLRVKDSPAAQLVAINSSLLNQVKYWSKVGTWSDKQLESIDPLFNKAYRSISSNQRSFPTLALYMPKSQLGMEFNQFSSEVQFAKYDLLQRSMLSTVPRRRFIASSLIARLLRQMRCQPVRHGPFSLRLISTSVLPTDSRDTWWASSVFQHMSKINIHLEREGRASVALPSHLCNTLPILTDHLSSLVTSGVMIPQELNMAGDTPAQLKSAGLLWALPLSTPQVPLPIRQGQVWARHDTLTDQYIIHEISGFHSDVSISVLHWEVTQSRSRSTVPHKVLLRTGTSAMRGASSLQTLSVTELFPDSPSAEFLLVTLSNEQFSGGNNTALCKSFRSRLPLIPTISLTPESLPWFRHITSPIHSTAFTEPHNLILDLFKGQSSRITTSVLMKSEDSEFSTTQHALVIRHSLNNLSEPSAQIFSLFAAASQSLRPRQTYVSMSSTAHKLHRKTLSKPVAHPLSSILRPLESIRMFPAPQMSAPQSEAHRLLKHNPLITPTLAGAHQDSAFWNRLFLLRSQFLTQHQLQTLYPSSSVTHVSDTDFLTTLLKTPMGALCGDNSRTPTLLNYKKQHLLRLTNKYYANRDVYRQSVCIKLHQQTSPHYWSHGHFALAAETLKHVGRGVSHAFIIRIVLDWHLTGRNKLKHEPLPDDNIDVGRCLLCDAPLEDQRHILCECRHPQLMAIRKDNHDMISKLMATDTTNSYENRLIRAYHTLAINPDNYELLLGRIHPHLLPLIESLPQCDDDSTSKASFSKLGRHCRQYLTLATSLYQTRHHLLDILEKDPEGGVPLLPAQRFDLDRIRGMASETLVGIHPHDVLTSTGTKVKKSSEVDPTTIISHKRILSNANSITLRRESDKLLKKQQLDDARKMKIQDQHDTDLITRDDVEEFYDRYDPDIQQPSWPIAQKVKKQKKQKHHPSYVPRNIKPSTTKSSLSNTRSRKLQPSTSSTFTTTSAPSSNFNETLDRHFQRQSSNLNTLVQSSSSLTNFEAWFTITKPTENSNLETSTTSTTTNNNPTSHNDKEPPQHVNTHNYNTSSLASSSLIKSHSNNAMNIKKKTTRPLIKHGSSTTNTTIVIKSKQKLKRDITSHNKTNNSNNNSNNNGNNNNNNSNHNYLLDFLITNQDPQQSTSKINSQTIPNFKRNRDSVSENFRSPDRQTIPTSSTTVSTLAPPSATLVPKIDTCLSNATSTVDDHSIRPNVTTAPLDPVEMVVEITPPTQPTNVVKTANNLTGQSGYEQLLTRSRASNLSTSNFNQLSTGSTSTRISANRSRTSEPLVSTLGHNRPVTDSPTTPPTYLSSTSTSTYHEPTSDPIEKSAMIIEQTPLSQHRNFSSIVPLSSTGVSGYELLLVRSRASASNKANHKRSLSDLPSVSKPANRRRSSDPPTSMSDHLRLETGAIDAPLTTLSSSDMRISQNVPPIDPVEHTDMIMELAPPVQHSNLTTIISHSSTGLSGYEQLLVRPRVFNLSNPEPEPKQMQHPVSTSAHRRRTLDVPVSASATKRLAAGSSDSTAYPVAVPPAFTILFLEQEEGRPHSASSGIRTDQTQRSSSEHWIPTPALIEPDTGPVMRCSPGTPGGKSGQG